MRKFLSLIAASLLVAAIQGCGGSPTGPPDPIVYSIGAIQPDPSAGPIPPRPGQNTVFHWTLGSKMGYHVTLLFQDGSTYDAGYGGYLRDYMEGVFVDGGFLIYGPARELAGQKFTLRVEFTGFPPDGKPMKGVNFQTQEYTVGGSLAPATAGPP